MHLSRADFVLGDPLRDHAVAWHRGGIPSDPARLLGEDGNYYRLDESPVGANSHWVAPYARTVRVPPGTPPGTYGLEVGPSFGVVVTVSAPPLAVGPAAWFGPDTVCLSADAVQAALDRRWQTWFRPGNYYFTKSLNLPPHSTLRGRGAKFIRLNNGDPNDVGQPLFRAGQDCLLDGLELVPHDLAFHHHSVVTGLTLKDCAIRCGNFGYQYERSFFDRCLWDGGGMTIGAPHGRYRRCRWTRNPSGTNAFAVSGPCVGGLVLEDCEFDDTDRGPVHRCLVGPVSDNLCVGLRCRNIQRDSNGNEMVSAEGNGLYGFDDNLVVGTRVHNCDGNFFLPWDAPARRNLVLDTVVKGGGGIWLAGVNDVAQVGNVYDQFELHDTDGIRLGWRDGNGRRHGLGIADNAVRNGAILNFCPSRLNQGRYDPAVYQRTDWLDVVACGPGNRLENVSTRGGGASFPPESRELRA